MAMRIAPPDSHANSYSHVPPKSDGAPSAPGIHDTLRAGIGPTLSGRSDAPVLDSAHQLESRLIQWRATQDAMRMEGLRRTFGMAEPIRRAMEIKIARDGEWRPLMLGGVVPGVHEDILTGRDTTIGWEDVFTDSEMRSIPGFHEELEAKVKMAR